MDLGSGLRSHHSPDPPRTARLPSRSRGHPASLGPGGGARRFRRKGKSGGRGGDGSELEASRRMTSTGLPGRLKRFRHGQDSVVVQTRANAPQAPRRDDAQLTTMAPGVYPSCRNDAQYLAAMTVVSGLSQERTRQEPPVSTPIPSVPPTFRPLWRMIISVQDRMTQGRASTQPQPKTILGTGTHASQDRPSCRQRLRQVYNRRIIIFPPLSHGWQPDIPAET